MKPAPQLPRFYLASRSPRRAELLRLLGLPFDALPADVPEVPQPDEPPAAYARRLSLDKAWAAARAAPLPLPVLGADTDVALDGAILGKPRDAADAEAMLLGLSGRAHEVVSAVTLLAGGRAETLTTITRVWFGRIEPQDARAYVASGEPMDKAGAYAIQGGAARWIERIDGSYTGVIGLPLYETGALLARFGIAAPAAPEVMPAAPPLAARR